MRRHVNNKGMFEKRVTEYAFIQFLNGNVAQIWSNMEGLTLLDGLYSRINKAIELNLRSCSIFAQVSVVSLCWWHLAADFVAGALRGLFMAHPSLWGCTGCGTNLGYLGDSGATTTAFSIWGALPDYDFFILFWFVQRDMSCNFRAPHWSFDWRCSFSDFVRGRPFSKKGFEIKWIRKLKTSNDKPNSINSILIQVRGRGQWIICLLLYAKII